MSRRRIRGKGEDTRTNAKEEAEARPTRVGEVHPIRSVDVRPITGTGALRTSLHLVKLESSRRPSSGDSISVREALVRAARGSHVSTAGPTVQILNI